MTTPLQRRGILTETFWPQAIRCVACFPQLCPDESGISCCMHACVHMFVCSFKRSCNQSGNYSCKSSTHSYSMCFLLRLGIFGWSNEHTVSSKVVVLLDDVPTHKSGMLQHSLLVISPAVTQYRTCHNSATTSSIKTSCYRHGRQSRTLPS